MFFKLFLFFSLASTLFSHQTGLSYVDIKEDISHKIEIVYKKPLSDTQAQNIYFRYPLRCTQTIPTKTSIENGYVIKEFSMWCGEKGLKNSRVWVDGLVAKNRGVLIRYENDSIVTKALLRASTPFIFIGKLTGKFKLFLEYVELGIIHIWSGYDHLLFVLSLVLLSLNMRALLFAITAFTLSHSITLALAILGFVSVPIIYVEAMIALSIVFLAKELLLNNRDSFTRRHLGIVAFIFGLLHGFGFSSVLASIGLPQDEIPLTLFAFNIGIETGQILFIMAVSIILAILNKFISTYENSIQKMIAYFIGMLSTYWLLERVLSF